MKKWHLAAECFTPDAIAGRIDNRKRLQEEVDSVFSKLRSLDISLITANNLVMTEDEALLLISSKLSFYGVVTLKVALDHVPRTYKATPKGASTPIRYSLIADIMNKKGFSLSPIEVQRYSELLESFCKNFLSSSLELGEILWQLTGEKDCRFNKFISPPVECCLKCDESLSMHNRPTDAIGVQGLQNFLRSWPLF